MTARSFTESIVEEAALAWLGGLGYTVLHGPNIERATVGSRLDSHIWTTAVQIRLG
jgi:hypothetical protein